MSANTRATPVACPHCPRKCISQAGLLRHLNLQHRSVSEDLPDPNIPRPKATFIPHPHLSGRKTTAAGRFLLEDEPPPPPPPAPPAHTPDSWAPFDSRAEFDFAFDHYVTAESSASEIRRALSFWDAVVTPHGDAAPWRNEKDVYDTIDQIPEGGIPWKVYKIRYSGPRPLSPPKWMTETYELCTRDSRAILHHQLATRDFEDKIHYAPYRHFNHEGKRVFSDLMSGEWAWRQADTLADDPRTHGAMFVPIVAGSDKTTVSVATGHQEFHPVWLSGIVSGWCPKCDAKPDAPDDPDARRRTCDKTDHYCARLDTNALWTKYGIRQDYRPFMHHFPRADIHELLSPDLLHQVIKGTFKDHIVAWVNAYLKIVHGETQGSAIIDEIDLPSFPGLHRFPDGRDFEQWTGDDSKALMKVYLPAIAGFVPVKMVQCLSAFLDFCYIARQNSLSADDLDHLDTALSRFHNL
ncbi:hypothetical protein CONPUDRAFT_152895 [Coniophora puteana RWD-64-598 SS2]|uniref:C2H2-type domain-containing protein n=1 Tax=Coniophora puteana (strain RWD-64-598) TaxID=741705 RepID=A0A5M3MSK0_CONPW|nr:uncharacterized protein CONPUDRAFT_152895 [Coniophora puteana RWD-64-598 SS2]EIW82007.1 hypothetical protein CONPUDRAFT_152895 [Coniophora puteana RWD-64-598 SS2]